MDVTSLLKTVHKEAYPALSPRRPELSQAGRTILITGGSSGIGLAIAKAFAQAGAKHLIIVGRRESVNLSSASKIRAEYPDVLVEGCNGDIGDLTSIDKLWTDLARENVHVDVLVLNAVKWSDLQTILALGRDGVWADLTLNVRSTIDFVERFNKQNNPEKRAKVRDTPCQGLADYSEGFGCSSHLRFS